MNQYGETALDLAREADFVCFHQCVARGPVTLTLDQGGSLVAERVEITLASPVVAVSSESQSAAGDGPRRTAPAISWRQT
jgi:hypothetical protein